jgi:hypothetical protein
MIVYLHLMFTSVVLRALTAFEALHYVTELTDDITKWPLKRYSYVSV